MGTVLLGVDAQHYAPEATGLALELCRGTGDKIILMHVHEFAIGGFGKLQVDCAAEETELLLSDVQAVLSEAGIDVDIEYWEVPVGRIAKAILEAADQHDARYIVLGSSHSTDLPHFPIGSVALRVLHHARRPVLVVPRRVGSKAAPQVPAVAPTAC
ncbi:MAG: universal stress protein [Streptosporangiaceae bacterium]